jgi:hypothetical protein
LRLQNEIIKKEQARPDRYYDLLYLPSSQYVQLAAVGYDHFFADFFFLRVIQAFGASYANPVNLGQLWAYFNSITDLDPHFIAAYSFGNLVIGEEGQDTERGLALLEKGIESNPQTYRLAFEAAFFSLWTLNEPDRARAYVQQAEQAPDAPDFISRWKGFIDEQMGRYHAAFEQFLREYLKAVNANEATLIGLNHSRLRSAVDEWYKAVLLEKAIAFHEEEGFYPLVEELEQDGAFLDVEWPDWPALSRFLDLAWESEQPLDDSEDAVQELAARFIRTGWLKVPDNPSDHPVFRGYLIWPGQEPKTSDGRDNPIFLGSELNVAFSVKDSIISAAYRIQGYREAHDGECPPDLATVSPTLIALQEPWGGEFIYDPETCMVYPSTHPDLGEMLLGYRRL